MTFRSYIPSRAAGRLSGSWGGVALATAGHAAVATAIAFGNVLSPPQPILQTSEVIFIEIMEAPAVEPEPLAPATPAISATVKPQAIPVRQAPVESPDALPEVPATPPVEAVEEAPVVVEETPVARSLDVAVIESALAPRKPDVSATTAETVSTAETVPVVSPTVFTVDPTPTAIAQQGPVRTVASYAHNPKPAYPTEARRRNQEGLVLLLVEVSAQGRASGVTVRESSGFRILDKAALRAVRGWTFRPALRNGVPVASTVEVPVRFFLN